MKIIISKIFATLFFLFVSISSFAAPGEGSDDAGGLEGGDALPGAPIDNYIIIAMAIAMLFAIYRLRSISKTSKN
jgi:hypothetical protein